MNTCVTTPTRRCHVPRPFSFTACFSADLSSGAAIQSDVGTSVMPPSNPFSARVRTSSSSPRVTTNAAPRRSAPVFFGALRGNVSWSPRPRAAQSSLIGHSAQAGFFGVQIEDPRSISACALSPARVAPSSVVASCWISGFDCGSGSSTANSRDTTRSMLPSTGMVRRPNAIAAIAAAVYGPIPGSARKPSSVSGNAPP